VPGGASQAASQGAFLVPPQGPASHQGGPSLAADVPAPALTPSTAPATAATPAPSAADVTAQPLMPSAADIAALPLAPSTAATPSFAAAPLPVPAPAGSLMTPAAHASPASQVGPALLSLATSTAGTQRLTLRLEPADLGIVQVRIDRPIQAPAHVDISVSRPETLTLMLRDQTQLQHALDQAGVPAEGRTLSFHLAGQDADSLSRQAGGFGQAAADARTPRNGATAGDAAEPDNGVQPASPPPVRWQRVGLDITA